MTRGQKPEWAPTPLAQWLREQLDGREKKWLKGEVAKRGHKTQTAADGAVNRWTKRGIPPLPAKLSDGYIALLTEIFGEVPPGADPARAAAGLERAVVELRASQDDLRKKHDALDQRLARLEEVVPASRSDDRERQAKRTQR